MYKLALLLGVVSCAIAADTTANLLILGAGDQTFVGRVLTSDATATTYSLDCPATEDPKLCGVPTSFSFTQGPSTVHYSLPVYNQGPNTKIDIKCQITSAGGVCTEALLENGSTASQKASSFTNFASEVGFKKVTLTGGPTPGATSATTTVPLTSAVSTASAAKTKTNESSTASSTSSSSPATSSSSSSTKVSTGGVQMITSHPQWMVGGAVAAAAAIAAL